MAWNTTHTRFYSTDLAGLECGNALKIPRRDREITKVAVYNGALEKGQCVAMVRVPAGARITGAELTWRKSDTTESVLAVGDPYACGRLLGPISTIFDSGHIVNGAGNYWNCSPWGTCGTLRKTSNNGDGCGLFYQYTCETDVIVTNLHHTGNAYEGGFQGGGVAANLAGHPLGGKYAANGQIVLKLTYLQAS